MAKRHNRVRVALLDISFRRVRAQCVQPILCSNHDGERTRRLAAVTDDTLETHETKRGLEFSAMIDRDQLVELATADEDLSVKLLIARLLRGDAVTASLSFRVDASELVENGNLSPIELIAEASVAHLAICHCGAFRGACAWTVND